MPVTSTAPSAVGARRGRLYGVTTSSRRSGGPGTAGSTGFTTGGDSATGADTGAGEGFLVRRRAAGLGRFAGVGFFFFVAAVFLREAID
jgi:hypothetical protein